MAVATPAFGNFYAAVTMTGTNFSVRGAMNADNPDTAKIISGLLAGLMQQGLNAVPDKQAQSVLQSIKMTPRENEIIWEADIPEQAIADFFKPAESQSCCDQSPHRSALRCAGSGRNKIKGEDQKCKSITLRLIAFALLLVTTVLFASAFRTSSSSAQNANSSTTTNKNQNQNDTRSITPPAAAQGARTGLLEKHLGTA